jgi:LPXTG-motif cell wall-anchored protein
MRATRIITTAAFGGALAVATLTGGAVAAHADSSAVQHPDYVGPDVAVLGETVSQAPTVANETVVAPAETSRGTLPITGDDSLGLAAAGLGLLGAGTAMYRRSRRNA